MVKTDDLVETAHIVKHFVVEPRGLAANIAAKTTYGRGEQFRQRDTDDQVRSEQCDGDCEIQRKQHDRVQQRGRDGDDDRRNGVRKEDFQQFDIGSDQCDQAALAFAGQFGGCEATKRGERFRTEQREQAEGHIVIHILFGVAHTATDQRADNHGCDCDGKAEIPDFRAGCSEQCDNTEDRQEGGGKMAGDTAHAGDHHAFT